MANPNKLNLPISLQKQTEDQFKTGYLNRPSPSAHIHFHTSPHDSILKKIWACRDMIYDPHWEIKNIFISFLKGMAFGAVAGGSFYLPFQQRTGFEQKKLVNIYFRDGLGILKVGSKYMIPFALAGGAISAAWYTWFNMIWNSHERNTTFWGYAFGYGIFGGVLGCLIIHPRWLFSSVFVSGLFGIATYSYKFGLYNGNSETMGFYVPYGDLSDEERKKQKNKDIIQFLSQNPQVKYNNLNNYLK